MTSNRTPRGAEAEVKLFLVVPLVSPEKAEQQALTQSWQERKAHLREFPAVASHLKTVTHSREAPSSHCLAFVSHPVRMQWTCSGNSNTRHSLAHLLSRKPGRSLTPLSDEGINCPRTDSPWSSRRETVHVLMLFGLGFTSSHRERTQGSWRNLQFQDLGRKCIR